jgi:hypothetical protein
MASTPCFEQETAHDRARAAPLAVDYLKRLRDAARSLSRGRRDDLMADIQDHLAEAAPAGASAADVRTALDRLGDPNQIVAAEQDGEPRSDEALSSGPRSSCFSSAASSSRSSGGSWARCCCGCRKGNGAVTCTGGPPSRIRSS